MSWSPADVQHVLDAIVEQAALACGADDANVRLLDGELIDLAAHYGSVNINPTPRSRRDRFPAAEAIRTGRTIHISDFREVVDQYPESANAGLSVRTVLATPLQQAGTPIGALVVRRREAGGFSEQQIALLETLAAQAAVAIENARMLNELDEKSASQD